MAEYHHIRLSLSQKLHLRLSKLMKLTKYVSHQHRVILHSFDSLLRKSSERIVVALDGEDRGNRLETIDHFKLSYIARMDDCINPAEMFRHRRIEQAMCVGDDADSQEALPKSVLQES